MAKSATQLEAGLRTPSRRAIILGAGRGTRGSKPTALVLTDSRHRVLDWILDSFSAVPDLEMLFVGGYRVDEVAEQYPTIRFLYNPDWAETGPVHSLAFVPGGDQSASYICYSDIVFRPQLIRRMESTQADLVLAIDSRWRIRYESRGSRDMDRAEKIQIEGDRLIEIGQLVATQDAQAEFVGLLKLSKAASLRVRQALRDGLFGRSAGIPDLIRHLVETGASLAFVDVLGDWAELNAPQDLASFVLGTKAESLERLRPLLRKGRIGRQVSFSHASWESNPEAQLKQIADVFGDHELIVRSSALSEDSWVQSAAGAYKSILGVPSGDARALAQAIDEVFESYGESIAENQVLAQRLLQNVSMSGVIMTRTPTYGAPYYVINFDSTTGSTETVTDGSGEAIRTVYVQRSNDLRNDLPRPLHRLLGAAQELEALVGHDSLDMEFAFTNDQLPHILQVRPIAVSHPAEPVDDEKVVSGIERARAWWCELQQPSPIVLGSKTRLSVMTDWNPAEMIGIKPRRLAFSLYRRLITDESWAQQRAEFGYRDVRPCNLIVDVLGHPYVDVRVDFNSFIPAALPDALAERLVDHYVDHLARRPELHDKVEFDILFTCLTFDFDAQSQRLHAAGFAPDEIAALRESLRAITQAGIARCASDVAAIAALEARRQGILGTPTPPLERAFLLLEDVRRLEIPLFSHLARHGFIAVAMLRSLQAIECLSHDEVEEFQSSLRTIPSRMEDAAGQVAAGTLDWEDFVEAYGHLRPGSYDITSECYADAPEGYLRPMIEAARQTKHKPRAVPWNRSIRMRIDAALREAELGIGSEAFVDFLVQGIEGRELGKFQFMKNINDALESIAAFGAAHGYSREDLAHVRIEDFFSLRGVPPDEISAALLQMVRRGKEDFYLAQAVCLPAQIACEEDFHCFEQVASEPNYITRKKIQAHVISLEEEAAAQRDIGGAIVLIPNADPGYDWIFSRKIAGLVTMYGGMNSHMAIRAAEFELPAAIGVGELLFDEISRADLLDLNCEAHRIRVVR